MSNATIPAVTNQGAKTYEEWRKLVDLHESYSKHVVPAGAEAESQYACAACGCIVGNDGKAITQLRYWTNVDLSNSVNAAWAMRYLLERSHLDKASYQNDYEYQGYEKTMLTLSVKDTEQLFAETGNGLAAKMLLSVKQGTQFNKATLKAGCMSLPYTAVWLGQDIEKAPNDATRAAASKDTWCAMRYAELVDDGYHPVTRMAALKKPGVGARYLDKFGSDFTMTDKERKRMCRTFEGSWAAAAADDKPMACYDHLLSQSANYGMHYLYKVCGEARTEWEDSGSNWGLSRLVYMAIFNKDPKQFGVGGDYQTSRIVSAYKDLASMKVMPTRDEVLKMMSRVREVYCTAWIMLNHTTDTELVTAACRNRHFMWYLREFIDTLATVNNTRAKRGLPLLVNNCLAKVPC
jgi:hypothetical protein